MHIHWPWKSRRRAGDLTPTREVSTLGELRREMDRMLDRFLGDSWGDEEGFPSASWSGGFAPGIDVTEKDGEITLRAEVPGVDPADLEVSLTGDVLTLRGEKRQEVRSSEEKPYHVERHFGSFERSMTLPAPVDPEQVHADYEKGVLTIRLHKLPGARPHRIHVQSR